MKQNHVYYSGYNLTPSYFRELLLTIPELKFLERPGFTGMEVHQFDKWKDRLPAAVKRKIPSPKYRFPKVKTYDPHIQPSHIFFPLRVVKYEGEKKPVEGGPDYEKITEETPRDREKLEAFARLVESAGGHMDLTQASFGYLKEIHNIRRRQAV